MLFQLAGPPPQQVPDKPIHAPYSAADQYSLFDSLILLAPRVPRLVLQRITSLDNEGQRDRILKLGFLAAVEHDPEAAVDYVPRVIDRPWLAEVSVADACTVAALLETQSPELAERLVWATARKNPDVALRAFQPILALSFGRHLFDRVVMVAPGDAIALAAGDSKQALHYRGLLRESELPEIKLLASLADDLNIGRPSLSRVAVLHQRIARGELSRQAALNIASSDIRYFGALVDLRLKAAGDEAVSLDRVLEAEAQLMCRAFEETGGRGITAEMSGFPVRDLYLLLAYGRAESVNPMFANVFDGLLLPRLRAGGARVFEQTHDLKLRELVAVALAVHRLSGLLQIAGADLPGRVARGIERTDDPMQAAVTVAEVIDGAAAPALSDLGSTIAAEYERSRTAGDKAAQTLYGLLSARMVQASKGSAAVNEIGARYLPYLTVAGTLNTALLFGEDGLCVQRHFFYDDEDGVESYQSFRASYQKDPLWKIEDRGAFVWITGAGSSGRHIEIFANVPRESRRVQGSGPSDDPEPGQDAISEVLQERKLTPTVLVHRGHNFHVEKTIEHITHDAKLVFLGSCGGSTVVHSVIERSREAQVIATRGIGTTSINDAILKSLNDQLLAGNATIEWQAFWKTQQNKMGNSGLFRDYFAPDQDAASIFLRAYLSFVE